MALIFAATPFFVSGALGSVSPMSLVFLRFFIAVLLQAPFFIRSGIRQMLPDRGDFKLVFSLGAFGMFAYHYLFIAAIGYTSPLNIAVIAAAIPIIASLIAAFKGLEPLSSGRVSAMLISLACDKRGRSQQNSCVQQSDSSLLGSDINSHHGSE